MRNCKNYVCACDGSCRTLTGGGGYPYPYPTHTFDYSLPIPPENPTLLHWYENRFGKLEGKLDEILQELKKRGSGFSINTEE